MTLCLVRNRLWSYTGVICTAKGRKGCPRGLNDNGKQYGGWGEEAFTRERGGGRAAWRLGERSGYCEASADLRSGPGARSVVHLDRMLCRRQCRWRLGHERLERCDFRRFRIQFYNRPHSEGCRPVATTK